MISIYPDDIQERGGFPYTLARASIIPSTKPQASEINVKSNVVCNPSKRAGADSIKKSINEDDVYYSSLCSPYNVAIFPKNSPVRLCSGFVNIFTGGPASTT